MWKWLSPVGFWACFGMHPWSGMATVATLAPLGHATQCHAGWSSLWSVAHAVSAWWHESGTTWQHDTTMIQHGNQVMILYEYLWISMNTPGTPTCRHGFATCHELRCRATEPSAICPWWILAGLGLQATATSGSSRVRFFRGLEHRQSSWCVDCRHRCRLWISGRILRCLRGIRGLGGTRIGSTKGTGVVADSGR